MDFNLWKWGRTFSVTALALFGFYTLCFAILLMVNPIFAWEGVEALASYEAENQMLWKYLGMGCMLGYACLFPALAVCVGQMAGSSKRLPARLAELFSLAFCVTAAIAYFVQMTATRLQLESGNTEELLQFTQSYNISALNAINMLGWTVFYPLASLALSFLFGNSRTGKAARLFCLGNALMMAAGFAGYLCNHFLTLLLTMNLGLGLTGCGMLITMLLWFRERKRLVPSRPTE